MADNKVNTHGPEKDPPVLRRVAADSVPYGESISKNGRTVWAAYAPDRALVCVRATATEAHVRYRELRRGHS